MSPPVSPPRHILSPGNTDASALIAAFLNTDVESALSLMRFGGVYLNRRRLLEDCATVCGDYLRIHPQPRRFPAEGIEWKPRVVRETEDYVVVDKPAGIPVHPTCDNTVENVAHQLGRHLGKPLRTTQRLDIATQGLLVLAKTAAFQTRFNGLLHDRRILKRYRALVPVRLSPGEMVHYMQPGERAPRIVQVEPKEGWKRCAIRIEGVREWSGMFEVDVILITGRTHQIRCQLAALGAPILGDDLYGSHLPAPEPLGTGEVIALQAYYLGFTDGAGGEAVFELPAPW